MTGPSDEDLQKIRDENEKLRVQIAAAKATKTEREAEASRAIAFAELATENTRLEAELASAKEAAKVGSVKAGTEGLMENLKGNLEAAVLVAEAPVGVVDTNASTKSADTNTNGGSN